ncbi:MAG: glycosyltransferase family 4 protein, partial [Anaerolineaceae bacterium]|nr:glycosyltransferase family 4 protein [Anaerolineaceae bacterium]
MKLVNQKVTELQQLARRKGAGYLAGHLIRRIGRKARSLVEPLSFVTDGLERRKFEQVVGGLSSEDVHLLVATFFDLDGERMYFGGAERYVIELEQVLAELGHRLIVFQCANRNWVRYFGSLRVIGISSGGYRLATLNRRFHRWVPKAALTLYAQMNLSTPRCHHPSICISHGIDWDAYWLHQQGLRYRRFMRAVRHSIRNVDHLVSVDTNTINWVRASANQYAEKCTYIPNFVDPGAFSALEKTTDPDQCVVLYPRRLSEARGFWMVAKILPELLEKFPRLRFHFCGNAIGLEAVEMAHLLEEYAGRIEYDAYPPEMMPAAYARADIVVIPTLYSEGTSLSCLEALASGCAVIATNVGGLPNLILPEFNGLLIEPRVDDLLTALKRLIEDESFRQQLALNGQKTAAVFDLEHWQIRWKKVLRDDLAVNETVLDDFPRVVVF